jgi:hypothetical protein
MGSGAFLVEACRLLAEEVHAAWRREGVLEKIAAEHDDPILHARRLVAQRCLYGVDKNALAVNLAKLSLWLVTLARELPFTFLDHALRHGDSLVGLDFEQIVGFHWKEQRQLYLCAVELRATLDEAVPLRQRILDAAGDPGAQRQKERDLWDATDALDRVKLIGDLVVGAYFSHNTDKAREKELARRRELVLAWLRESGPAPDELRAMQEELRRTLPVFHWMVEFPEVFFAERPDPLDEDQRNQVAYVDAFVGNPPFVGGRLIRGTIGDAYTEWLAEIHGGSMNTDLCGHFFRRANRLLGAHGTIGLLATKTLAQGDTRATALKPLVDEGLVIYDAVRSMPWPGDAAVSVSVVHLAKGNVMQHLGKPILDAQEMPAINSRLRGAPERSDPAPLAANAELSFQGSIVAGLGFTLSPQERDTLIEKNPKNDQRIFPYLGGEEVNTSPTQSFDRYVISFGSMMLEQAEEWSDLLAIVREKVKPERDRANRDAHRKYWWHFGDKRPALYEAIAPLDRCLVTARVTKHLCFSFQPTDRIFHEKLFVFPLPTETAFSVLQSRIHAYWVWLLSSTLEERLNYSATDCFENFPFPKEDPRAVIPSLEDAGKRLYDARAKYMVENQKGLTQTYNALKDPACDEPAIVELRALHEALDRAVLDAYGFNLDVPPYCPKTPEEQAAVEAFSDQVLDALFVLNEKRAAAERLLGAGQKKPKGKKKAATAQTALALGGDGERTTKKRSTKSAKKPGSDA